MRVQTTAVISFIAGMSMSASAAPRDIQFINIHPESEVLQLFNSSDEPISIEGWRFCSHNTSEVRRYTSPSTFDGVVIPAQTSFTIHLDDDAGFNEPLEFNASSLGLFAGFELDAYSISLYFPNSSGSTPFGDGNFIADHIQWSIDGIDNTTADERSDEAEAGGVWMDQSEWINVGNDTVLIELIDPLFQELHSPADYNVIGNCPADLTGDGILNFFDVSAFLSAFTSQDPIADFTGDLNFNFFDVSAFLSMFTAGCP